MQITATQKNIRQTPRKLRLVANAVKKLDLQTAVKQLSVIERGAALPVLKVVRQAIADAMHNHGARVDQLTLKSIIVSEGPTFKRFRAVSRGRAHRILKRSAHVSVTLAIASEEAEEKQKAPKAAAKKATQKKSVPAKKTTAKKSAPKKKTAAPKKKSSTPKKKKV